MPQAQVALPQENYPRTHEQNFEKMNHLASQPALLCLQLPVDRVPPENERKYVKSQRKFSLEILIVHHVTIGNSGFSGFQCGMKMISYDIQQ